MRKLIVLSFITLDGVMQMQAPGGPEKDIGGGFQYGGWNVPYSDESSKKIVVGQMSGEFDLLLGRKTYDIFAAYWPLADIKTNPIAASFSKATKHVVTQSPLHSNWEKTTRIEGNAVEGIRKLKNESGPDLQVHGSGKLIQMLLKHDLVDELWLKTFPVTLGTGKRLFEDGTIPAAFQLFECKHSPGGIIFANYRRAGDVTTGTF